MKNHTIKVRDRFVTTTDAYIVLGNVSTDTIELDLDEEWNGFSVEVVLVKGKHTYRSKWNRSRMTLPPTLASSPGFVGMRIEGSRGEEKITTALNPRALRIVGRR